MWWDAVKSMRRMIRNFLKKNITIRNLIPDAYIAIDIIVGVPEETEQDFQQTIEFLTHLHHLNIYSHTLNVKILRQ